MATTSTTNTSTTISFNEDSFRPPLSPSLPPSASHVPSKTPSSTTSTASDPDSVPYDPGHAQNWTTTTAPADSWAVRERRRASMWAKAEMPLLSPPKKAGGAPRRGSVLSVWKGGKDKDGRDILVHDEGESSGSEEEEEEEDQVEPLGGKGAERRRKMSVSSRGSGGGGKGGRHGVRRGSILSLWSGGKDASGRDVMVHDDEEWTD